jgi:hypothetical protein
MGVERVLLAREEGFPSGLSMATKSLPRLTPGRSKDGGGPGPSSSFWMTVMSLEAGGDYPLGGSDVNGVSGLHMDEHRSWATSMFSRAHPCSSVFL